MGLFILLSVKPEYGDLADYTYAGPVILIVLAILALDRLAR